MSKSKHQIRDFFLAALPSKFKNQLIRRSIDLAQEFPRGLEFKIAETIPELEAAYRLVYDCQLRDGACKENSSKMLATPFHALPSTTTLLALQSGQVVATLTLVRDNRLGLPLEKKFNLSSFREKSKRLAEITSVAIHPDYQGDKLGLVLFPLLKLMYEYATSYFGVSDLLIQTEPWQRDLFQALFLFKKVETGGVLGAGQLTSVVMHLDLRQALHDFATTYRKAPLSRNLYHFFTTQKISAIKLPERTFHKINDPVVSLADFHDIFVGRLSLLSSPEEAATRKAIESSLVWSDANRVHPRVDVEMPISCLDHPRGMPVQATLKDVSRGGFRVVFADHFKPISECQFEIEVAPKVHAMVQARPVWISVDRGVGFEILSSDKAWQHFIDHLYEDQFKATKKKAAA